MDSVLLSQSTAETGTPVLDSVLLSQSTAETGTPRMKYW